MDIELGNNDDLGLIASRIADLPQAKTLTGAEAITPSIFICQGKGSRSDLEGRELSPVDTGSAAEPNFFLPFFAFIKLIALWAQPCGTHV